MAAAVATLTTGSLVSPQNAASASTSTSPFPLGVIFGTSDTATVQADGQTPQQIVQDYEPWFQGQGRGSVGPNNALTSNSITVSRVGVNGGDIAACGAAYYQQTTVTPDTCFNNTGPSGTFTDTENMPYWSPSSPDYDNWGGTVVFGVPMIQCTSQKASLSSPPTDAQLTVIQQNLDYGAYGGPDVGSSCTPNTKSNKGAFPYWDNYANLAQALVDMGLQGSDILISTEAEGSWSTMQYGPDADAWVKYYKNIVDAMRSVSTAEPFKFVWPAGLFVSTTTVAGTPVEPTSSYTSPAWPGSSYVDVIGLDFHDLDYPIYTDESGNYELGSAPYPKSQAYPNGDCEGDPPPDWQLLPQGYSPTCTFTKSNAWQAAWNTWYSQGNVADTSVFGLQYWEDFAAHNGKPLALTAWGLINGGADYYFVKQVWNWLVSQPTAPAPGSIAFAIYDTGPSSMAKGTDDNSRSCYADLEAANQSMTPPNFAGCGGTVLTPESYTNPDTGTTIDLSSISDPTMYGDDSGAYYDSSPTTPMTSGYEVTCWYLSDFGGQNLTC
jgi:hypothetical protein